MINFLDKYKDKDIMGEEETTIDFSNRDEVFAFTVKGELQYNHSHPFFGDQEFFGRLLKYYQANEMYEQCQLLIETKNR
ncbi:MAG: hypothetical protein ACOC31_02410 [Bacteroidota bacterium]